ncbi:FAD-dependent oxidoreductase [Arcanobacterium hippocoleae]|uniref:FAD-dependent oxidoreductase n=1 Tax=Arcanobacterium hippocoleae TaxID=149017 RepID=UPI003618B1FF
MVGAGVAGSVAAIDLARKGHNVALIERGQTPGEKNLSGGIFYSRIMEQIFPNFLTAAPIERKITRNIISFLNNDSHVNIDYWDNRLADPVNAVSVLRGKLDAWLADQAEAAGVMLMPGVKVDQLLHTEAGEVCGIIAGEEELTANIVIAADGVNSFLAQEAGIREKQPDQNLAVGVKSVYKLPAEKITERFNLGRNTHDGADTPNSIPADGAAFAFVGDATQGVAGGGFLYTNHDTISVGVVLRLDDLQAKGLSSAEIHDHFLNHPAIIPYLKDAQPIEYGCHLTIENGPAMVAQPISAPGFLIIGDAAGFTINNGFTIRGMDLAAQSALCAAKTADNALTANNFSAAAMSQYRAEISASWLGADLDHARHLPEFLENPRIFENYGQMLADTLYGIYNIDLQPRKPLRKIAFTALQNTGVKLTQAARDGIAALRAF